MPFEPLLPPALTGSVTAFAVPSPGPAPATIISTAVAWSVHIEWEIHGLFALGLAGDWHVKAFLESMGPGVEMQAGPTQNIPLAAGVFQAPDRRNYTANIPVAAGATPAGVYKLVTTVTYTEPSGQPGPMAAYQEGPVLQFFEP